MVCDKGLLRAAEVKSLLVRKKMKTCRHTKRSHWSVADWWLLAVCLCITVSEFIAWVKAPSLCQDWYSHQRFRVWYEAIILRSARIQHSDELKNTEGDTVREAQWNKAGKTEKKKTVLIILTVRNITKFLRHVLLETITTKKYGRKRKWFCRRKVLLRGE